MAEEIYTNRYDAEAAQKPTDKFTKVLLIIEGAMITYPHVHQRDKQTKHQLR